MGQMHATAVFELAESAKHVKIKMDTQANYYWDLGSGVYPASGQVRGKWQNSLYKDIDIEANRKNVVEIMVKMDRDITNVNGSGIALGHPVGCTGARIIVSLLREMNRRGNSLGLATLCVGGGMGAATIWEMI